MDEDSWKKFMATLAWARCIFKTLFKNSTFRALEGSLGLDYFVFPFEKLNTTFMCQKSPFMALLGFFKKINSTFVCTAISFVLFKVFSAALYPVHLLVIPM
jgi:hypothetical protein